MRIVSMVPSWTETLIECGVDVVGRTRFCIHPAEKVKAIPVVGGTKDIKWEKIDSLKPDLVILDKEENPKSMADESPWPVFASHIRSVEDVGVDLEKLGHVLPNDGILKLARRWKDLTTLENGPKAITDLPGVEEWIRRPGPGHSKIVYLIWHKPWMAVSPKTFIGSVLAKCVGSDRLVSFSEPYPEVDLKTFDPAETVLLFSTEPFPFARKKALIPPHFASAIVDGAAYSWFGVRSLKFLEEHLR